MKIKAELFPDKEEKSFLDPDTYRVLRTMRPHLPEAYPVVETLECDGHTYSCYAVNAGGQTILLVMRND